MCASVYRWRHGLDPEVVERCLTVAPRSWKGSAPQLPYATRSVGDGWTAGQPRYNTSYAHISYQMSGSPCGIGWNGAPRSSTRHFPAASSAACLVSNPPSV